MSQWLNKTFLKFLSRFIIIILLGIVATLVAGYFNEIANHEATTAKTQKE